MSIDPRAKVIDDLLLELQKDISQGHDIILCGDFNEPLNSKENTHSCLEHIGLTNILSQRIGELPRTFIRGKSCIDHFYTTSRVAEAITSVGIAPFNFFLPSFLHCFCRSLFFPSFVPSFVRLLSNPVSVKSLSRCHVVFKEKKVKEKMVKDFVIAKAAVGASGFGSFQTVVDGPSPRRR